MCRNTAQSCLALEARGVFHTENQALSPSQVLSDKRDHKSSCCTLRYNCNSVGPRSNSHGNRVDYKILSFN